MTLPNRRTLCAGLALLLVAIPAFPADGAARRAPDVPPYGTLSGELGPSGRAHDVRLMTTTASGGTRSTSYGGTLPVRLAISRTGRTYAYDVENTSGAGQDVPWTGTDGVRHTVHADLQLPLVATLSAQVPAALGVPVVRDASVTTETGGGHLVVWSLVLFSPLGRPSQQLTLTVPGHGPQPKITLRAVAVAPIAAQGLAASGQGANANVQTFDTLQGYTAGSGTGLRQLADGTGRLVDGLGQLYDGAVKLHSGLGAASSGAGQISTGAGQAHGGSAKLGAGLKALGKGQKSETAGLAKLYAGLAQLADAKAGLPGAVDGVGRLQEGVGAIVAGIGSDAKPATLLGGFTTVIDGLDKLEAALKGKIAPGVACAAEVVAEVANGNPAAKPNADGCWQGGVEPVLPGVTDATSKAYLLSYAGALTQVAAGLTDTDPAKGVVAGLASIGEGLRTMKAGLSHRASGGDPGGVLEGLQAIDTGLGALKTGLQAASSGVGAIKTGTGQALTGSRQLSAGTGQAASGADQLTAGLLKLRDGARLLAAGTPAAVTGAGQIADGLAQALTGGTKLGTGIDQLTTQAAKPLATQVKAGSDNARQQIAVLQAAADRVSTTPHGADPVVLTSETASSAPSPLWYAAPIALLLLLALGVLATRSRRRAARHRQPTQAPWPPA